MNNLIRAKKVRIYLLIYSSIPWILNAQCSFQYISNDTIYQDYIELIYSKKNKDEIVAIGSQINRGTINDSVFNAPVFRTFDYCGKVINKIIYQFIGNNKLAHRPMPTHNTYKEEPIGNTNLKLQNNGFLLVDKATDTLLNQQVLILFSIDENGKLVHYQTLNITDNEANHSAIKNVIELRDGNILVILWDYSDRYSFYYFDKNYDYLYKKSFSLGRGIRNIKQLDNGDFICTSLAYDNYSFQIYRMDTDGEIKWMLTPFNTFGSAREVLIKNNTIYITGAVNYGIKSPFGVFMICDINGSILKQFIYDTFFCQPKFCSAYLNSDNTFVLAGYIEYCDANDIRSPDLAIIGIDTSGSILWNELYNFENAIGTKGPGGYNTDYGGFAIARANDGSMIINGMSRYSGLRPGGILHDDAILVKTLPIVESNLDIQNKYQNPEYYLKSTLLNKTLDIFGPVEKIVTWMIFSIQGKVLLTGHKWENQLTINEIKSGIYIIKLMDMKKTQYYFRFVKM